FSTTSGMRSPVWMVMGKGLRWVNRAYRRMPETCRGLENAGPARTSRTRAADASPNRNPGVPDMSIVRYRQRPAEMALQDEIKQVFDRFFGQEDTDSSAVVTAQWVPRVDIKEEAERFVIYADLPGID